jgi:tripartite-type tricarboxylate transporter receptor subunit TctC
MKKGYRSLVLLGLAGVLLIGLLALTSCTGKKVLEEDYPSKPIDIIIPFDEGGPTDLQARVFADIFSQYIGVSVNVINKSGARGATGTSEFLRGSADGYKIYAGNQNTCILFPIQKLGDYQISDFTPIGRISTTTMILVCASDKPWKNINDLIEDAKQRPVKITYGSPTGWMSQLGLLIFSQATDIKLQHMTTMSESPAFNNTLKGYTDIHLSTEIATVVPKVKDGTLRALAVFSETRDPLLPEVPTLKELGIDVVVAPWIGVAVGKNCPDKVVKFLRDSFDKMVQNDENFAKRISESGGRVNYMGGEDFSRDWQKQTNAYQNVLK